MTKTERVRLSPSGRYIGSLPTVLLQGPGSIGRMWRRHGDSTPTTIASSTAGLAAIPTLDAIAVDMRPGYLYDAQIDYAMTVSGTTIVTNWSGYYRLHAKAANTWGAWVQIGTGVHELIGDATSFKDSGMVADAAMAIGVTVTVDAIEFGLAATNNTPVEVNPRLAFARIAEYMP